MQIAVIKVTDENCAALVEVALSMYLGEACKYCGHVYDTLADLRERGAVYAGYHENGRSACKACWDANNSSGTGQ